VVVKIDINVSEQYSTSIFMTDVCRAKNKSGYRYRFRGKGRTSRSGGQENTLFRTTIL
jgi:hypothetical protein